MDGKQEVLEENVGGGLAPQEHSIAVAQETPGPGVEEVSRGVAKEMPSADSHEPFGVVDHQEPSDLGIQEPSNAVEQGPPSTNIKETPSAAKEEGPASSVIHVSVPEEPFGAVPKKPSSAVPEEPSNAVLEKSSSAGTQEISSPFTPKPSGAITQKLSGQVTQEAPSRAVQIPSLAFPQDIASPAIQKTLNTDISPRRTKWVAPTVQSFLAGDVEARTNVIAYLKRYNHLPKQGEESPEKISNALAEFQSSANLVKSGIYDEATEALMNKPRCSFGRTDVASLVSLKTRSSIASFVKFNSKWDHRNITYRFENFTPTMTPAKVRQAIQLGLGGWAAITPLSFTEVTTGEDILIRFVSGAHGDKDFDGLGPVVAHAFPPGPGLGGDTHFDEDENWNPQFLAGVALHEFGHALGLDHSKVPEAVMWEFFTGLLELHDDDIHGIHSIYGWREPRWQNIDFNSATVSILASENEVYQLHNNGSVWRYTGPPFTGWQLIDDNPETVQLAAAGSTLYQRHRGGQVYRYEDTPMRWTVLDINSLCLEIVAGGGELYQRLSTGYIYRFQGLSASPRWELIDDNPRCIQITAGDTALWQRHNNGSIWRYIGPGIKWSLVQEGAIGPIAAGARGDRLYQHAGNNILEYSWTGPATATSVIALDKNPATTGFYVRGTHMYQIHQDGSIWRFSGTPITGWEMLDNLLGTVMVVGSESGDVFELHSDGRIWRLVV